MVANFQQFINVMGFQSLPVGFAILFGALAIWSIVWKGLALWRAAKNESKAWYVVMLIVNTLGILEIVYIFFFSKKNKEVKNQ